MKIGYRLGGITIYVLILHFMFSTLSSSYYNFTKLWWYTELNLYFVPYSIAVVYISVYYFLPRFFYREKYVSYVLWQSLLFITLTVLFILTEHYVLPYFYQEYTHSITGTSIIKQFMAALMILPLPIIYRISVFLYQNQRAKLTLEAQKLESELKLKEVQLQLLNHQLQPHFLFNTLNNLYSLAYHKSDQTLEVITRISDLLSFVIYDCNSDTIALEKEIQLLRTYIELEKIRYGKRLTVDFVLHGNINGYSLPPMLLFPFLENSFKHGASTDYKNPWIKIKLNIEDSQLTFQIENSKTNGGNIEIQEDRTRVGILNTRKRLDLLYPSRYKLEISDNVVAYKVELVLPL